MSGCKEPERHFQLIRQHIFKIREIDALRFSNITIYVERNLGFEAEHIERAIKYEPGVFFYHDVQARRTGIYTTENVKLGAMTMTNVMLREHRIHILPAETLVSQEPIVMRRKLQEQLQIYSLQFKVPENVFQKGRYALSGKVGGLKDDIVICLQLGVYWTDTSRVVDETITPVL